MIDVFSVEELQNDLEKMRAMARLLLEYYSCKEPDIEYLGLHLETLYDMADSMYNSATRLLNTAILGR